MELLKLGGRCILDEKLVLNTLLTIVCLQEWRPLWCGPWPASAGRPPWPSTPCWPSGRVSGGREQQGIRHHHTHHNLNLFLQTIIRRIYRVYIKGCHTIYNQDSCFTYYYFIEGVTMTAPSVHGLSSICLFFFIMWGCFQYREFF